MAIKTLCNAAGQPLSGPVLIKLQVFNDDRGFFTRAGMKAAFVDIQLPLVYPLQKPRRLNSARTITPLQSRCARGLHFQLPPEPQGKLCAALWARFLMWRGSASELPCAMANG